MAAELGWESWPGFGEIAVRAMENYQWPGNVRELRNVIERAVYRWADPNQPVDYVQFDPFESPWKETVAANTQNIATSKTSEVAVASSPRYSTDLSHISDPASTIADFRVATEAYEKAVLEQALGRSRYNQRQTAKALNLSYDQLRHTLKKHDLLG